MSELEGSPSHIDLGASIGKAQAFAALANKSAAAQAAAFREIRDAQAYKLTGLTWEEFCPRYIGLTRPAVDRMIQNLEEFGQTYFRLSEIAHVPPAIYRRMKRHIDGDTITFHGECLPIVPENAVRIREAVQYLRAKFRTKPGPLLIHVTLSQLRSRFETLCSEVEGSISCGVIPDERMEWARVLRTYINRLSTSAQRLL